MLPARVPVVPVRERGPRWNLPNRYAVTWSRSVTIEDIFLPLQLLLHEDNYFDYFDKSIFNMMPYPNLFF